MRKQIIAAFAAIAIFSGASMNAQTKQEAVNSSKEVPAAQHTPKYDSQRMMAPFEGLNLTEQQRKSIEQINTTAAEQKASKKAERRNERRAMRSDCDSVKKAHRQQKDQLRRSDRQAYLAKIKAVLTPEQYVQFLENNFTTKMSSVKGAKNKQKGKHSRYAQSRRNKHARK